MTGVYLKWLDFFVCVSILRSTVEPQLLAIINILDTTAIATEFMQIYRRNKNWLL